VTLDVWFDVEAGWWRGCDVKSVENLQMNSNCEESGCCVLCDRDYCES